MFSKNLKYFRLKNNINMSELANRTGITKAAISNYEKGIRTPDMQTLYKLAEALNVNIMDFMIVRDEKLKFMHNEFRKNTTLSKSKQEYVREEIEEYFNRFFIIVNILGEYVLPIAPECGVAQLSEDDEDNAIKLRGWLNISPEGPVGNLVDILENKGILIYLHEYADANFSGINGTINSRPYIAMNKNMNAERQRFTIAHELAHMFFIWSKEMDESTREKKASSMAGAFLFPKSDAIRELGIKRIGIQKDMLLAAKEYGISMLCLAYRAKELKIVNETAYRKFSIETSKAGWRRSEPSRIEPEESTLFKQLVFRAVVEDEISIQKGAELLKLPFDEVRAACQDEG